MIAYEFRGSACDGYTSSFRQMTEMERSEGSPIDMDVNASSFEAPDGASMQFKIDTRGIQDVAPVAGTATRGANDDVKVELTQPAAKTIDFGRDIIFPTQHVEKLIEAAKAGGGVVQARVYDGSDTGAKIYATMAIIGKEATKPSEDAANVAALKDVRRWPVVVSYFNEASKDLGAGVRSLLRSLRERRFGQPQARLRRVCAQGALAQARNFAGLRLRETALEPRSSSRLSSPKREAALDRGRAEFFAQGGDRRLARLLPAGVPVDQIGLVGVVGGTEIGRRDADQPIGCPLRLGLEQRACGGEQPRRELGPWAARRDFGERRLKSGRRSFSVTPLAASPALRRRPATRSQWPSSTRVNSSRSLTSKSNVVSLEMLFVSRSGFTRRSSIPCASRHRRRPSSPRRAATAHSSTPCRSPISRKPSFSSFC